MMSRNKKLVVSLFCGIGGLDLGLQSAGFEVAVAIDNNAKVLELHQHNFPDTLVLCRDIATITAAEIREIIQQKYPDWDGEIAAVIGGPPCQGFSVAGKQNLDDSRSQLVLKFINLVVELNPSTFVMENVPAIEWKKFAGITGDAIALIQEHYILSKWLLTASDYGVPQKRQRAIWIGSKFGEVVAPNGSENRFCVGEVIPKVSAPACQGSFAGSDDSANVPHSHPTVATWCVFDAIADLSHIPINSQTDTWELNQKGEYAEYLDKIFPGTSKSSNSITGCKATVHTPATQQKYGYTLPGEKEATTWAYRLSADAFSPTLRAGSGNRTAARPIHYEHARVITVREAARLHSFPDWFNFGASKLAAHKAIGNSVPPLLAYAIASQVWTHLQEQQYSTMTLQCSGTNCCIVIRLRDLQFLEKSLREAMLRESMVNLLFCHSIPQPKKQCFGTSALVDGENRKVARRRKVLCRWRSRSRSRL